MITIEMLTEFLGWCTVINFCVLIFSSIALVMVREPITKVHAKMFGIHESGLSTVYFQYLGNYKIAILVLNLVPYIALKLMA